LQVLLVLVSFAYAVLANPHWRGHYDRHEFERHRFRGGYYERPDGERVIVIIRGDERPIIFPPFFPAPITTNSTAASNNTVTVNVTETVTGG